jgi:uncharacterized damage-inducible protein DinB
MTTMTWTAPAVARPDGKTAAPEPTMLPEYLDWCRATLLHKCAGLTGDQLACRSNPPSSLSLLGLIRHLAKVERIWFRERFLDEVHDRMYPGDKDADFDDGDPAKAQDDYDRLIEEQLRSADAVRGYDMDATFTMGGEPFSLRLIYLHMIQEYSRHNGHADMLREQLDGVTGG